MSKKKIILDLVRTTFEKYNEYLAVHSLDLERSSKADLC